MVSGLASRFGTYLERICPRERDGAIGPRNGATTRQLCRSQTAVVEWNGDLDLRKKCNQLSSRHRPIWAPCNAEALEAERRSGTGTAGIDNCRSAGGRGGRGRGRSPAGESVGGNDQGGADESLERTEGFCASRVTSSGLSAWSTSVLVSHRDGFARPAPRAAKWRNSNEPSERQNRAGGIKYFGLSEGRAEGSGTLHDGDDNDDLVDSDSSSTCPKTRGRSWLSDRTRGCADGDQRTG